MNTKIVSRTSKLDVEQSERPASDDGETCDAAERRRLRRQYYKLLAPADVPHRRLEARRWLDEEAVLTSNGRVCERRPGQRLLSVADRLALSKALDERLREDDPELHRAVARLVFEENTSLTGISLDEWKIRSHRRSRRISRVRAKMQRAGLL